MSLAKLVCRLMPCGLDLHKIIDSSDLQFDVPLTNIRFLVREMDNRDEQKVPLAGSYMNSVNQPPPIRSTPSPSAPYPAQFGSQETTQSQPPSYATAVAPQPQQNFPQNKGFNM